MEKQVKALETLTEQLSAWKTNDEASLGKLVAEFEKIPRQEFSKFYTPVLSDNSLAETLVEIGEEYASDAALLSNIVSGIGVMVMRYELKPSDKVFNFFLEAAKNKKANFYVSLYISFFPQFETWDGKWDYLLSIPNIAPKKKSMDNFHTEMKRLIKRNENIPSHVVTKAVGILDAHTKSEGVGDYTRKEYINTIKSLLE